MSRANRLVAKRARRNRRLERRKERKMADAGNPDEKGVTDAHRTLLAAAKQMHEVIGEIPTKWGGQLDAAFGQFAKAVDTFLIKAGLNPIPPKLHAVENADGTPEPEEKKADEPTVQ